MRGFGCTKALDRSFSTNTLFLEGSSLSDNGSVRGSCDFSEFYSAVLSKLKRIRHFLKRFKSRFCHSDLRVQQIQSSRCNQLQPSCDQNHQLSDQILQAVMNYKLKVEKELADLVGVRRAQDILRDHLYHWDITILASTEDSNYASDISKALKDARKGLAVAGPWEIKIGDNWMSSWEQMLMCSEVVVVLVSKAFFQDRLLSTSCCDLVVLRPGTRLIPVYLEELRDFMYPEGLHYLSLLQGLDGQQQNARIIAQSLVKDFSVRHILRRRIHEITTVQNLIVEITSFPDTFLV